MNGSGWGYERAVLGLLIGLCGIYFILERSFPAVIYSELKNVRKTSSVSVDSAPRKGRVIPVSGYGRYLLNPHFGTVQDKFGGQSQSGAPSYDAAKINWLAEGTDGQKHPSNAFFSKFVPFQTTKQWLPLLAVNMRVRYMRDDLIDVSNDVWQTSVETYIDKWGDCEDHAILLADWLIGLGHDARVVAGTFKGEGHAWVVLHQNGAEYLLETTNKGSRKRYPLVSLNPEYVPAFMFNRDHFWVRVTENTGRRNRIVRQKWIVVSDFREKI